MKSYPFLFLLPLLLFVRLFELLWVVDRAPAVAPPAAETTEAQPAPVSSVVPGAAGKRNPMAENKTAAVAGARLPVNAPVSVR